MKKLLIGLLTLVLLLLSGCVTPSVTGNDSGTQLKKSCDMNNGKACHELGLLYGPDGPYKSDLSKALKYFDKACDLKNAEGCHRVGLYYEGTKKDYSKSRKYYKKACNLNDGVACIALAEHHAQSIGIKQDYSKAKEYYKKGCDLDDAAGCVLVRYPETEVKLWWEYPGKNIYIIQRRSSSWLNTY